MKHKDLKRKSATTYPWRRENKREPLKVSNDGKKLERKNANHFNGDGHGNGDGRRQSHRNRAAASAKPPPNSHRPRNMFLLTFPAPGFFYPCLAITCSGLRVAIPRHPGMLGGRYMQPADRMISGFLSQSMAKKGYRNLSFYVHGIWFPTFLKEK